MTERTNGLVSPAQMDTTKYPPGGQKEECPHTDDKKWCYCESGKMGLTDKTGKPFACLWCGKSMPKTV